MSLSPQVTKDLGKRANEVVYDVEGYKDGFDLSSPEPSSNRSHSYRHGFKAGRADRGESWGKPFDVVQEMADEAMAKDDAA